MAEHITILVVDDDPEIRRAARMRLQATGYLVLEAGDGSEALASAQRHRPDAILLDIRMPVMDGLEFIRRARLQKDIQMIPIVVLSASVIDRDAALDVGARFFVTKPYLSDNLLEAVSVVLGVVATDDDCASVR